MADALAPRDGSAGVVLLRDVHSHEEALATAHNLGKHLQDTTGCSDDAKFMAMSQVMMVQQYAQFLSDTASPAAHDALPCSGCGGQLLAAARGLDDAGANALAERFPHHPECDGHVSRTREHYRGLVFSMPPETRDDMAALAASHFAHDNQFAALRADIDDSDDEMDDVDEEVDEHDDSADTSTDSVGTTRNARRNARKRRARAERKSGLKRKKAKLSGGQSFNSKTKARTTARVAAAAAAATTTPQRPSSSKKRRTRSSSPAASVPVATSLHAAQASAKRKKKNSAERTRTSTSPVPQTRGARADLDGSTATRKRKRKARDTAPAGASSRSAHDCSRPHTGQERKSQAKQSNDNSDIGVHVNSTDSRTTKKKKKATTTKKNSPTSVNTDSSPHDAKYATSRPTSSFEPRAPAASFNLTGGQHSKFKHFFGPVVASVAAELSMTALQAQRHLLRTLQVPRDAFDRALAAGTDTVLTTLSSTLKAQGLYSKQGKTSRVQSGRVTSKSVTTVNRMLSAVRWSAKTRAARQLARLNEGIRNWKQATDLPKYVNLANSLEERCGPLNTDPGQDLTMDQVESPSPFELLSTNTRLLDIEAGNPANFEYLKADYSPLGVPLKKYSGSVCRTDAGIEKMMTNDGDAVATHQNMTIRFRSTQAASRFLFGVACSLIQHAHKLPKKAIESRVCDVTVSDSTGELKPSPSNIYAVEFRIDRARLCETGPGLGLSENERNRLVYPGAVLHVKFSRQHTDPCVVQKVVLDSEPCEDYVDCRVVGVKMLTRSKDAGAGDGPAPPCAVDTACLLANMHVATSGIDTVERSDRDADGERQKIVDRLDDSVRATVAASGCESRAGVRVPLDKNSQADLGSMIMTPLLTHCTSERLANISTALLWTRLGTLFPQLRTLSRKSAGQVLDALIAPSTDEMTKKLQCLACGVDINKLPSEIEQCKTDRESQLVLAVTIGLAHPRALSAHRRAPNAAKSNKKPKKQTLPPFHNCSRAEILRFVQLVKDQQHHIRDHDPARDVELDSEHVHEPGKAHSRPRRSLHQVFQLRDVQRALHILLLTDKSKKGRALREQLVKINAQLAHPRDEGHAQPEPELKLNFGGKSKAGADTSKGDGHSDVFDRNLARFLTQKKSLVLSTRPSLETLLILLPTSDSVESVAPAVAAHVMPSDASGKAVMDACLSELELFSAGDLRRLTLAQYFIVSDNTFIASTRNAALCELRQFKEAPVAIDGLSFANTIVRQWLPVVEGRVFGKSLDAFACACARLCMFILRRCACELAQSRNVCAIIVEEWKGLSVSRRRHEDGQWNPESFARFLLKSLARWALGTQCADPDLPPAAHGQTTRRADVDRMTLRPRAKQQSVKYSRSSRVAADSSAPTAPASSSHSPTSIDTRARTRSHRPRPRPLLKRLQQILCLGSEVQLRLLHVYTPPGGSDSTTTQSFISVNKATQTLVELNHAISMVKRVQQCVDREPSDVNETCTSLLASGSTPLDEAAGLLLQVLAVGTKSCQQATARADDMYNAAKVAIDECRRLLAVAESLRPTTSSTVPDLQRLQLIMLVQHAVERLLDETAASERAMARSVSAIVERAVGHGEDDVLTRLFASVTSQNAVHVSDWGLRRSVRWILGFAGLYALVCDSTRQDPESASHSAHDSVDNDGDGNSAPGPSGSAARAAQAASAAGVAGNESAAREDERKTAHVDRGPGGTGHSIVCVHCGCPVPESTATWQPGKHTSCGAVCSRACLKQHRRACVRECRVHVVVQGTPGHGPLHPATVFTLASCPRAARSLATNVKLPEAASAACRRSSAEEQRESLSQWVAARKRVAKTSLLKVPGVLNVSASQLMPLRPPQIVHALALAGFAAVRSCTPIASGSSSQSASSSSSACNAYSAGAGTGKPTFESVESFAAAFRLSFPAGKTAPTCVTRLLNTGSLSGLDVAKINAGGFTKAGYEALTLSTCFPDLFAIQQGELRVRPERRFLGTEPGSESASVKVLPGAFKYVRTDGLRVRLLSGFGDKAWRDEKKKHAKSTCSDSQRGLRRQRLRGKRVRGVTRIDPPLRLFERQLVLDNPAKTPHRVALFIDPGARMSGLQVRDELLCSPLRRAALATLTMLGLPPRKAVFTEISGAMAGSVARQDVRARRTRRANALYMRQVGEYDTSAADAFTSSPHSHRSSIPSRVFHWRMFGLYRRGRLRRLAEADRMRRSGLDAVVARLLGDVYAPRSAASHPYLDPLNAARHRCGGARPPDQNAFVHSARDHRTRARFRADRVSVFCGDAGHGAHRGRRRLAVCQVRRALMELQIDPDGVVGDFEFVDEYCSSASCLCGMRNRTNSSRHYQKECSSPACVAAARALGAYHKLDAAVYNRDDSACLQLLMRTIARHDLGIVPLWLRRFASRARSEDLHSAVLFPVFAYESGAIEFARQSATLTTGVQPDKGGAVARAVSSTHCYTQRRRSAEARLTTLRAEAAKKSFKAAVFVSTYPWGEAAEGKAKAAFTRTESAVMTKCTQLGATCMGSTHSEIFKLLETAQTCTGMSVDDAWEWLASSVVAGSDMVVIVPSQATDESDALTCTLTRFQAGLARAALAAGRGLGVSPPSTTSVLWCTTAGSKPSARKEPVLIQDVAASAKTNTKFATLQVLKSAASELNDKCIASVTKNSRRRRARNAFKYNVAHSNNATSGLQASPRSKRGMREKSSARSMKERAKDVPGLRHEKSTGGTKSIQCKNRHFFSEHFARLFGKHLQGGVEGLGLSRSRVI